MTQDEKKELDKLKEQTREGFEEVANALERLSAEIQELSNDLVDNTEIISSQGKKKFDRPALISYLINAFIVGAVSAIILF